MQVRVRWDTERFVCKLSDSCVTSMHDIKSIRMFEDDVIIQGGALRGFGRKRDACCLKYVCLR